MRKAADRALLAMQRLCAERGDADRISHAFARFDDRADGTVRTVVLWSEAKARLRGVSA